MPNYSSRSKPTQFNERTLKIAGLVIAAMAVIFIAIHFSFVSAATRRLYFRRYSPRRTASLRNRIPRTFWRLPPVGKPVRSVVESRAAFADPGGEIGVLI